MIAFKRVIQSSIFLNPFTDFSLFEGKLEIRWDPLTHITSRIVYVPTHKLPRFDYTEIITASPKTKCPFCPENIDSMVSRFDKRFYGFEGIEIDGVRVIPNILTFDKYCIVAIISKQHFLDINGLIGENCILRGIKALIEVLKIIQKQDRKAKFYSINCNYMPMSGSSILHPHIQAIAGEWPTNYHGILLKESRMFYKKRGVTFWDAFMEKERELNERFIGQIGSTYWYAPFAPKGNIDIGCLFSKNSIFEIDTQELSDFAEGLRKTFIYLDGENISGFNLSIFSGIKGEDHFRTNVRIIARRFLPPTNAADSNYFDKLHAQSVCLFFPEDVTNNIKKYG